jgi:hypothetical protein
VRTTRDALTDLARERYTEQQLVEILRRAAERQEGLNSEPDGRFSLAEIQQFASEVGIDPAHVAVAAAELAHSPQPPPSTVLGAPTAFRFERWLDGEIPTSAIGELFDVARRETGLQGQVSEALDTVEWRGRGSMGAAAVSVARRNGRTQISVYLTRGDAAVVVGATAGLGGLACAVAIGSVLAATAALAGPVGVVGAAAVSLGWGGAGSWLAMRGIWRRVARRWATHADALGNELVALAQRAIDAARKESE